MATKNRDRRGPQARPETESTDGPEAPAEIPVAASGPHSRRTGHKPKYIQYEGLHPARREHAPDAAP